MATLLAPLEGMVSFHCLSPSTALVFCPVVVVVGLVIGRTSDPSPLPLPGTVCAEGRPLGEILLVPTMAHFGSLTIHDHADGWGPPPDLPPAKFRDMPYAPFSKSDRLGRAADWSAAARFGAPPPGIDGADDEEGAFTTVDTRTIKPSGFGRGRGAFRGGRTCLGGLFFWSRGCVLGDDSVEWAWSASGLTSPNVPSGVPLDILPAALMFFLLGPFGGVRSPGSR